MYSYRFYSLTVPYQANCMAALRILFHPIGRLLITELTEFVLVIVSVLWNPGNEEISFAIAARAVYRFGGKCSGIHDNLLLKTNSDADNIF